MGELIYLSRQRIQITLYVRRRRQGRPADQESELTVALVQGLVQELGKAYFDSRTRTWPGHMLEALLRGGWHSPVVMVGHTVVSQRVAPDRAWLRGYLKEQVHRLRPRLARSS